MERPSRTRFFGYHRPFFDEDMLCSPLLAMEYMPKGETGHNSQRLHGSVVQPLSTLLEADWKDKLSCSVSDGASNVKAAIWKDRNELVPNDVSIIIYCSIILCP